MSRPWRTERIGTRSTVPRKIALTGVSAVIAYVATTFFGQPTQIWSVTLATFIGGVALVVQLLVEFDTRMANAEIGQDARMRTLEESQQKHSEQIEQLVRESYVKINEATELFALVEASALRTDVVTQFVKHSTQIRPAPALIFDFAQGEIARMSEFLKEISRSGYVAYDGEDRDWLLGLTRHAQSSIDATSLTAVDAGGSGFGEGGLWSSDLGQRYLEVQRDAVQPRCSTSSSSTTW
ncbi:MAG: hypothetical protein AUI10_07890 [Actinobacteria bacterium 13_2_20CM_2_72_6]|nr:MAG: hypothetical protein AUI10_07890 [Actinobacteria bacterium 13_2_20CM_2_72_6]